MMGPTLFSRRGSAMGLYFEPTRSTIFPIFVQLWESSDDRADNVVALRRKPPTIENGKVPPRRQCNVAVRSREYLTPSEVATMMHEAGKAGRHGHRDATLIFVAYRHGLRVSEMKDVVTVPSPSKVVSMGPFALKCEIWTDAGPPEPFKVPAT